MGVNLKRIKFSELEPNEARVVFVQLIRRSTLPETLKLNAEKFINEVKESQLTELKDALDNIIIEAQNKNMFGVVQSLNKLKIPPAISMLVATKIITEVNSVNFQQ